MSFSKRLAATDVPIAAICGATIALARAGLLDNRRHTSNAADYRPLHATEYKGAALYAQDLAVRDGGVITASGLGALEFAREIFEELDVLGPTDRSAWFEFFKCGPPSARASRRTMDPSTTKQARRE